MMSKKGTARPEWTHTRPHNSVPPVPALQGKAKSGKEKRSRSSPVPADQI